MQLDNPHGAKQVLENLRGRFQVCVGMYGSSFSLPCCLDKGPKGCLPATRTLLLASLPPCSLSPQNIMLPA